MIVYDQILIGISDVLLVKLITTAKLRPGHFDVFVFRHGTGTCVTIHLIGLIYSLAA